MFVRRKILVSLQKEELEQRIEKSSVPPFHRAKISGNHFRAYIPLKRHGNFTHILSSIHGVYMISGNDYLVQYAAEPAVGSFFVLAAVTCLELYGLLLLFCGQESQRFVLAGVIVELIIFLDILWQEQESADRFENSLRNGGKIPPCPDK